MRCKIIRNEKIELSIKNKKMATMVTFEQYSWKSKIKEKLKNVDHRPKPNDKLTDEGKLEKVRQDIGKLIDLEKRKILNYFFNGYSQGRPYHMVAAFCIALIGVIFAVFGFMDSTLLALGVIGAILIVAGTLLYYWSISQQSQFVFIEFDDNQNPSFLQIGFHLDNNEYIPEYRIEYNLNLDVTHKYIWKGNRWVEEIPNPHYNLGHLMPESIIQRTKAETVARRKEQYDSLIAQDGYVPKYMREEGWLDGNDISRKMPE